MQVSSMTVVSRAWGCLERKPRRMKERVMTKSNELHGSPWATPSHRTYRTELFMSKGEEVSAEK